MINLKLKTGRFTWSKQRVGAASILARLDRFLVHSSLLDGNQIVSSKILPKLSSDHHPIALVFEKEDQLGPIPFYFCPLWIERDGFMDIVKQAWIQLVHGSPSYVWEKKLMQTKNALKKWLRVPLPSPSLSRKDSVEASYNLDWDRKL